MKRTIHRQITKALFTITLITVGMVISCVEVGPVPEFEYSYEFETSLPEIDLTQLIAPTITISEGSVDNAGAVSFSNEITNPATATNYASAVGASLSAGQETYWTGKSAANIETLLNSSDATLASEIASASTAFANNTILQKLVPSITAATASASRVTSEGRVSESTSTTTTTTSTAIAQQSIEDELNDCRQAAIEAFEVAVAKIEVIRDEQLASIAAQYGTESPLIESQRSALEASAQTRHSSRISNYLILFNTINTNINNLSITEGEKAFLRLANSIIYALSYNSSKTLLASELTLINDILAQVTSSFSALRTTLEAQVQTNYDNEYTRLLGKRNSTQNSCHNQGGASSN